MGELSKCSDINKHERIIIRNERKEDYREVEELTRKAFWNLSVPGCNEHYLAHIMREHEDFVPELDLVAELDHQIVGSIMYTKSILTDDSGNEKQILTFGPISILPTYQRRGYGKILMETSFQAAVSLGYEVIVIYGNPDNYVSSGFKSCKRYNISLGDEIYPAALLVKELKPGVLDGRNWMFAESPLYEIEEKDAELFDQSFEPMEKRVQPSQEEFYIHSHSILR